MLAILFASAIVYAVDGDDAGSSSASTEDETNTASDASDAPPKEKIETPKSKPSTTTENEEEDDWGSFYDPNKVFCGEFDCYKILGFDHETWGSSPPSLKDITKSYRGLSRKWHPDKNKAKGAREKFVVSSTSYDMNLFCIIYCSNLIRRLSYVYNRNSIINIKGNCKSVRNPYQP